MSRPQVTVRRVGRRPTANPKSGTVEFAMSDNRPRPSYQLSSPRGPAQPTPHGPLRYLHGRKKQEPEIDVMEYVRLIWARRSGWRSAVLVAIRGGFFHCVVADAAQDVSGYHQGSRIQPPPQLSNNQFDLAMSWWQMDRIIADQVEILEDHESSAQRVVVQTLGLESHPAFADRDAARRHPRQCISAEPIEGHLRGRGLSHRPANKTPSPSGSTSTSKSTKRPTSRTASSVTEGGLRSHPCPGSTPCRTKLAESEQSASGFPRARGRKCCSPTRTKT